MNKIVYYILQWKTNPTYYLGWNFYHSGNFARRGEETVYQSLKEIEFEDFGGKYTIDQFNIVEITEEERIIDLNKKANEKMEDSSI